LVLPIHLLSEEYEMAKTRSLIVPESQVMGDALGRLRGTLTDQEIAQFAGFGIAATLPGMRYQWDQMGTQIRRLELLLAGQQAAQAAPAASVPRHGRPPQAAAVLNGKLRRSGWSSDPEERKKDMARRMANRVIKKNGAVTRWNNATPAQRKRWLKAMQKGKHKKTQTPVVSLEQAS
jgi:hypothetical protein